MSQFNCETELRKNGGGYMSRFNKKRTISNIQNNCGQCVYFLIVRNVNFTYVIANKFSSFSITHVFFPKMNTTALPCIFISSSSRHDYVRIYELARGVLVCNNCPSELCSRRSPGRIWRILADFPGDAAVYMCGQPSNSEVTR